MTTKYFAILTNQGAARLANATALGIKLDLTQIAVGDGGGTLPTPDPAQTALKGEKRRAAINLLTVDAANPNQIIAEQVIPESEGGWWIREIGLFDKDGTLIAVANCPETYKPQLQEGSGRTQTIRMVLIVSNTEAVTLKIDPSVVLATREFVDNAISAHAQSRNHPDASLTAKGFVQLSNATDSTSETLAATPKAVNQVVTMVKNLTAADVKALERTDFPVGIPQPWPTVTVPNGWLKCNGATFNKATYPLLAVAYPSGVLPDLRGEFIRGWDDGRGVDAGRALLSMQGDAIRNISGAVANVYTDAPTVFSGALKWSGSASTVVDKSTGTVVQLRNMEINASLVVPTASENRPRNIALNYIVRAA